MARIGRAIGFALATALLSSLSAAAATLSDTEQDRIAAAVFDYALTKPTYFSDNALNFQLYLSIRGKDPSPKFLTSIHVSSDKFRPQSAAPASAPPQDAPIASRSMPIVITSFVETSPGNAEGRIGTICGPRCGSINNVTVAKENGGWVVKSFKIGSVF